MKLFVRWIAFLLLAQTSLSYATPRSEMRDMLITLKNDPSRATSEIVRQAKSAAVSASSQGWFDLAYLADSYAIEGLAQMSQFDQVKRLFQAHRTDPQAKSQPGAHSRYLAAMQQVYEIQGDTKATAIIAEQLEGLLENTKLQGYDRVSTLVSLGSSAFQRGQFVDGLNWLREANRTISGIDSNVARKQQMQLGIMILLGNQYFSNKDFRNAQRQYTQGLKLANTLNARSTLQSINFNLSLTYLETKEWKLAYEHGKIAAELAKQNDEPINYGNGLEVISKSLLEQGSIKEAETYQKQALEVFRGNNLNEYVFFGFIYLADIYVRGENRDEAESALMQAKQMESFYPGASDDIEYAQVQYKVAQLNGDYRNANALMSRYIQLLQDDYAERESAQSQRLMMEYEVESAQSKAEALALDNDSKNKRLAKKDADWQFMAAFTIMTILSIGALTVMTLRERRNRRKMHRLAMTDALTGAPNRRAMEDAAVSLMKQLSSTPTRVGVALLDIDHFKRINDVHGHDVGDVVLKTFVETCRPLLRQGDVLGRWGGEEFLLLLPNATPEVIQQVFSRLQQALSTMDLKSGDAHIRLTISMGASIIHTADERHFIKDIITRAIKQADDCVYQAKGAGRNQLVVWRHDPYFC